MRSCTWATNSFGSVIIIAHDLSTSPLALSCHSSHRPAIVVMPWLEDAIGTISFGDGAGALGLADFGCSEGRNSIAVMRSLIPLLRRRTGRHIQTVHCDLPTNDFIDSRGRGGSTTGTPRLGCQRSIMLMLRRDWGDRAPWPTW